MIGIDTNILLRLWLDDVPAQNRRIDRLLAEHGSTPGSLMVTDVVLAEAVWTLASVYRKGKADQLLAVRSLLQEPAFAWQDRETVEAAVALFEGARCGFSDCMIAATQARVGCDFGVTFDKRMRGLPLVRVI